MNTHSTPDIERARDLGRRIRARIQEFEQKGGFADARSTFLRDAQEKCAQIDRKLEAAIAKDGAAAIAVLEAQRDYESLRLEIARVMDQIAGMR
jgi:hypothetical protein